MAITSGRPNVHRFGLFELDVDARELRKGGIRVKLQEQPFQILATLLERPGEVVTREELQKRLWPSDTFVDFDLSLNSAIKKLRQALNDDSDNPRYIETLYRRGYRFIGPVNGNSTPSAVEEAEPPAEAASVSAVQLPAPTAAIATPRPGFLSSRRLVLLAAALLLLAAAGWFWMTRSRPIRVLGYTQITHDGRPKLNLMTDGERLYMTEVVSDRITIAQVSTRGGETSLLKTPFTNVFIGDIAQDGSSALVADFKDTGQTIGLWSLSLPAGIPRRVGDSPSTAAAWSPDGKQMAYASGGVFYLANADGSNPRRLASVSGQPGNLQFSPDGSRFRFDLTDRSTQLPTLWEMSRSGSGLHPLLRESDRSPADCCGVWTRDGRYYVFQSYRSGAHNIWVLPETPWWRGGRHEPIQLTNGPLEFTAPVPSVDGKKIYAVGSHPRAEVGRLDPRAGLVPYPMNISATDLAFSSDGQWVAYVTIPERTLWRSRVDGSQVLQLSPTSSSAALPRWSPDGKQIVFMARIHGSNYHSYLIPADGGTAKELAPDAPAGFDPNWTPDGRSIVLALGDPAADRAGISVLNLASGRATQLPNSSPYFSPRVSPDGKYILAITIDSQKLVLFDVATQRWSDLLGAEVGPKGYPSWSHDSQYVYCDTLLNDTPAEFRIRVSDRKLEKLYDLSNLRRFPGEFGSWTGLAPDDSLLYVRDMSNQEVYALDWEAP